MRSDASQTVIDHNGNFVSVTPRMPLVNPVHAALHSGQGGPAAESKGHAAETEETTVKGIIPDGARVCSLYTKKFMPWWNDEFLNLECRLDVFPNILS